MLGEFDLGMKMEGASLIPNSDERRLVLWRIV